ncbi:pyridine nucleotide-disulfide oxidoreductase [Anaerosporomusa subterranea]|uniref:Dihydrolipoyl dehydrogenase n=1 Tax=Anaerosporomusa subterranea TaxID=1794912 RepID=A0A154BPJ1_ANASB|nr:dihydrolipoyl dehydrogenase [Anaerosporomusa subterranea]KYZ75867.1 pyridine nucleotide-disulfide oxidoreductase [Anaerosporomusa subterranea]
MNYDVAVLGGGPGGYVAAIRAAQLGAKVLLVEKDQLGGVCLNRGCIPTKTLLKSAEKWHDLQRCSQFGLKAESISFDYNAVNARKNQVVEQMREGILKLVKSNAIDLEFGTAKLIAKDQICVSTAEGEKQYSASKIILATGSAPMALPVPGGDLAGVINSDQLLAMTEVPKSMVVIGAGAVGIEFAAIFQAFGCNVTVIEMMPAILPNVDSEIVKRMALLLRKQGIKFMTNTRVIGIKSGDDGVVVEVCSGDKTQEIATEKVLASIGRFPLVSGLGLDEVGIAYSRKGITVNEKMETNITGIYAIGDVTGKYMWAHAASAAGMAAAENACGKQAAVDYKAVPGCIYTTPEAAMTGLTEQDALAQGKEIKVSKFNFAANGKAVSMGEPDGLVKIIADKLTGAVLGMHILGAHASDLIMEGALAIQNKLSAKDLAQTIHPHPSLSEAIMECAHGIDGDIVHQVKMK